MAERNPQPDAPWQLWIDTGGTFTDCLGRDPDGCVHRVKVLSTSALRAEVRDRSADGRRLRYRASWRVPDAFFATAWLRVLGQGGAQRHAIRSSAGEDGVLMLEQSVDDASLPIGAGIELAFDLEAPVLAAHLLTGTPPGQPLPPIAMRLATTRGTNALLERRGADTALFVTAGFGDLLTIGDQRRPDLFALRIDRPPPIAKVTIEVAERIASDGTVLRPLDLDALGDAVARARGRGIESAAVALLNSYRNPLHERQLAAYLSGHGFRHVSVSSALSPSIKIVPRAATAVVNATLAPILDRYLQRVRAAIDPPGDATDREGGTRLHVMTSAGGLVRADRFAPKDSLLSGPAGGVVGTAAAGRAIDRLQVIAFDMGGTSTDVSRIDGDPVYRFEHRVADATVAAPALDIETVAAGGGSICRADGPRLRVGPQSAGADPGPACYGAGGPLTLTDVNVLLGRLDPDRFGIPLVPERAEEALDELAASLAAHGVEPLGREALLQGCLDIANERMAGAIRRISVARGEDPREHALVAFGGAGGQHACAVASVLDMDTVVLPEDAGLLSAAGLGAAVVERFASRPVLQPLDPCRASLGLHLDRLATEAHRAVVEEGVPATEVLVRRRLLFLRLAGQETTLEVEDPGSGSIEQAFARRYRTVYGYRPPDRPIEVESVRVVASSRLPSVRLPIDSPTCPEKVFDRTPGTTLRSWAAGQWQALPGYDRGDLPTGAHVAGPCVVFDPYASLYLEPGWRAWRHPSRHLIATRA